MPFPAPPQAHRYVGRFAPTPSGYLHFGSLVAALASYLDARAVGGRWLLRMEDIDPPREMPGAQRAIVETLSSYGFEWDGEMLRQSERQVAYGAAIERLLDEGLAYACTCSRKQLEGYPGPYPGFCRNAGHGLDDAAIRLQVPDSEYGFTDRVQGEFRQHLGRLERETAGRAAVLEVQRDLLETRQHSRPVVERRLQGGRYVRHGHGAREVAADDQQLAVARAVAERREFHGWPFQLST